MATISVVGEEPLAAAANLLTDAQAAIYDRQLRVWGLDVQNRLSAARVIVVGNDGVSAEVAKNLVLAGVGLLAIADLGAPRSEAHPGNFLVPASAAAAAQGGEEASAASAGGDVDTVNVAEACVQTLKSMNPLIRVDVRRLSLPYASASPASPMPGSEAREGGGTLEDTLREYDTVVASVASFEQIQALESVTMRLGKQLFCCMLRGPNSITFVNLNSHTYTEKAKDSSLPKGLMGEPLTSKYPPLEAALSCPLSKLSKRSHPLYAVARAAFLFEKAHGRPVGSGDLEAFKATAADLVVRDLSGGSIHGIPREDLMEAWAADQGEELAPVAAIVGGVVANHVIRAVSRVNEPLRNLFFFGLFSNEGVVEDMGGERL